MEALHQRLDREAHEKGWWSMPRAEARNTLIEHYLPFAEQLSQSRSAKNSRVEYDDCLQEACLALMDAVDSYDPDNDKGATFTTFSSLRVRGGTVEAERKNDWVGHKVRSEHGESLPKMGHFKDGCGFMAPKECEDDELGSVPRLEALLDRIDPVSAERLESIVSCNGDLEEWAKSEGIGVNHARVLYQQAVIKAQRVPVDSDGDVNAEPVQTQATRKAAA